MARKLQSLRRSALASCKWRGHTMGRFKGNLATCKKCGAWVQVLARPLPNEIDIGGPAVAVGCKRNNPPQRHKLTTRDEADTSMARLYHPNGMVSHYPSDQEAYRVWLAVPKGRRLAFRGANDMRPVYSHDYADRMNNPRRRGTKYRGYTIVPSGDNYRVVTLSGTWWSDVATNIKTAKKWIDAARAARRNPHRYRGMKRRRNPRMYNVRYGIGKSKYVVNFHDGAKKHRDGSPFFDIRIFKNKRRMQSFVAGLKKCGYANR